MTENPTYPVHGQYHHNPQQRQYTSDPSKLNIDDEFRFYAIVVQLIIGLMANFIVLCSMAISIRRRHRFDHHHQQVRRKRAPVPVVDIIITLLVIQSILRLLFRPAIQLGCFYGFCIIYNDLLCYFQGFVITFIHYVHLWTMMMFLQDRYIKHYKQPNDYLYKCTHMVLYLTMSCAMFLVAIHLCAPIYGLSSYGFLHGELTCAVDWTARHSCPFYVYSVLLVSGPASLPTIYWTIRITYRSFIRKCWTFKTSNFSCLYCCFPSANQTTTTTTTTTTATVSCRSPPIQQHNSNDNNHHSNVGNCKIPIIPNLKKVQIKQNIDNPPSIRFSSLAPLSPCPLPSSSAQKPAEDSKNDGSYSAAIRVSSSTSSCDDSILSSSGESCSASVKNGQRSNNTPTTTTTTTSISCGTRGCLTVIPMKKLKVHKRTSAGSNPNRNCSVRETAIHHHDNGDNNRPHRLQALNSNKSNKNDNGRADTLPRSHTMFVSGGGVNTATTTPTTATSSSTTFTSPSSQLCRSLVLNEHRELITVAICAWIFLFGYLLKLSSDAWQSCFLVPLPESNRAHQPSTPTNQHSNQRISMAAMSTVAAAAILVNNVTNQTTGQHNHANKLAATPNHAHSQLYFKWFLAAYLDEMATTVLIPLILLILHQRLRVILGICSEFVCLFKSRIQNWVCFRVRTVHHYHRRDHIAALRPNSRNSVPQTATTRRRSRSGGNLFCRCCCPPVGTTGGGGDDGGSGL